MCLRMVNPSPIYWSLSLSEAPTRANIIAANLVSVARELAFTPKSAIVTENSANMRKAISVYLTKGLL